MSPVSCDGRRDSVRKGGQPSPRLPAGSSCQPAEQNRCSFPISVPFFKWGPVGLCHLQGTEVRLGKAILDPLRISLQVAKPELLHGGLSDLGTGIRVEVTVPRQARRWAQAGFSSNPRIWDGTCC